MAERASGDAVLKELNKEIREGCPARSYLLYGSEPYLIRSYRKKICDSIGDMSDSMNTGVYSGSKIDIKDLISTADTMPFFKERRLILVENSGFFSSSCDELADYLKDPSPATTFVFAEYGIDKKTVVKTNTRMYKAVSTLGKCIKLDSPDEDSLVTWTASLLAKSGKKIRTETVKRLMKRSGSDMNQLSREVEKLVCYTEGREVIEDSDVDEICTHTLEDRIFDMTEALTAKNADLAFELYYDMVSLKIKPLDILRQIAREYHMLLRVKELTKTVSSYREMSSILKVRYDVSESYMKRCRLYSMEFLQSTLDECLSLDRSVKSGMLDGALAVELFLSRYSK